MDQPFVIKAQNISKRVTLADETLEILSGIDLEIKKGDSLAIVGRSGSGKTTLLGLLAGLDTASDGAIYILDRDLSNMDEEERASLRAKHVGFIFQSFQLLSSLTALENVMLPLELRGDSHAKQEAEQFLERVGLGDRMAHFPHQLSGGEQQRVAIARAFACKPSILFADEPTGNLDTATGQNIIELLFELNRTEQTTLIMVTHDESLAAKCHSTLRLESGRVSI
ncbi:ABC transporter ATP-binding protein [Alkalimarinus alittae]|uniref:ATP-binding cassette domain-containing protein n=1 Tax=Alkalimarinus alittae TaxID=2961619 RepID=A0ABY6MYE6_9ALTE|nr:ATP-binding cassette domain-containing protein [Alkalimarinus alittae]UZE94858.1 ATP-binding cassette domain-containing protein [Alkalimarinus alittae]